MLINYKEGGKEEFSSGHKQGVSKSGQMLDSVCMLHSDHFQQIY